MNSGSSLRRYGALGVAALCTLSAACGSTSNTINWFVNSPHIEQYEPIASACEKSSGGAYKVNIVLLPSRRRVSGQSSSASWRHTTQPST